MGQWWDSLNARQQRLAMTGAALATLALLAVAILWRANPRVAQFIPFLRPDPWAEAIRQTQALLEETPELEQHLLAYQTTPVEIDAYTNLLDSARPPLNVVDELQRVNVPLLGNAWQLVVNTLNAVIPGSGQALDTLDETLREAIAFKGRLAALRETGTLLAALHNFEISPSRKTLLALRDTSRSYAAVLDQTQRDVQAHGDSVSRAVAAVEGVEQAMGRAEDALARVPVISGAARRLRQSVTALADPLRNLQNALTHTQTQIVADLRALRAIESIVAAVEQPE